MNSSGLQIGEIATHSGVSVDTVRYYERLKLLPRAARLSGGFRIFPAETVERIKFIKQAQELSFSLDEVRDFLTNGDGINECRRIRDLLRVKLTEIDERIKKMSGFRHTLRQNLAACEREISEHGKEAHCPIIVNIEGK